MRAPLIHREPANARERAQLHPETTDLEREAARVIAGENMEPTPAAAPVPHIPPAVAHVASALSPLLVAGAAFLPAPFSVVAFCLGFVAAFLGGLALPAPTFTAAAPKLSAPLVPLLATVATAVAALSDSTTGPAHVLLALAGIVLAWLAGKMAPQPKA